VTVMRVGVGSFAFRWSIGIGDYRPEDPMGPEALVGAVAECGAGLVQFADNLPLHERSDDEISALARTSREAGVAIQLGTNSLDPGHLNRQAELVDMLGADVVRIAPGRHDLQGPKDQVAERLRAAGDLFAAKGSLVALENHFLLAPRDLAELVRRADHPGVRVCLDVANSLANGEWPDETIATLAPHTGNLHIKDYEIELDPHGVGMHVVGTAMGEGRLDLGATLDAVPDVDVIVEHWLPKTRFADHAEARRLEFDWTRRGVAKVAALAQAKEQGVKAQGVG